MTVKYVTQDKKSGSFIYRRRVPKALAGLIKKSEFLKVIGKTLSEALTNYGAVHQRIEHLLSLSRNGVTGLSPLEQAKPMVALLSEWGLDPYSEGKDENERTARDVAASELVEKYQDIHTGEYVGVPEGDAFLARALLGGISEESRKVTVTDAFRAYLAEKGKSDSEQLKKQTQRLYRGEQRLISILGRDMRLSEVTRSHARAWRDSRVASGVAPATIRRERNDISAVFGWAISELNGAGENNPFSAMKIADDSDGRQTKRLPLPQEVINGVYADLKETPELLRMWTLLDYTGARPSEIRMLLRSEFVVNDPIPHVLIAKREGRTLKSSWSTGSIPLVGEALEVAKGIVAEGAGETVAFPKYAGAGGMDRLSNTLGKIIRTHSKDPKHTTYSLRHNMKDRMRAAEVFPETAKAIEGHALSAGQDSSYGEGVSLQQKQVALAKALQGYREAP